MMGCALTASTSSVPLSDKVGHIDDDAEPIAFFDDLCAEVGETSRASLPHAITDLVAHIVREAEAAQPKPVEIAQVGDFLLQRRATFKANHEGNLSLALGAANVRGCLCENEMLGLLPVLHACDQGRA